MTRNLKSRRPHSQAEITAIARIEKWHSDWIRRFGERTLAERAALIHKILEDYHGNVELRLNVFCRVLGCAMRTLEREFKGRFGESMGEFQKKTRLEYAKHQMSWKPKLKLAALAASLGYKRESEFRRFFRAKTGESPMEFIRKKKMIFESNSSSCNRPVDNEEPAGISMLDA